MSEIKPKKEKRFLKTLGRVGEILVEQVLLKLGSSIIKKIGGKKTLPSILFIFLSFTLFAQYPNTGNKQRLGFQTTGDGLTWRGSLSDTASIQPINNQNAWVILDTVNLKFYSFDFTSNVWNLVGGAPGLTMPFDSITFNTAKDGTVGVGEVEYNDTQGSLIQGLKGGLVTNVIGQQLHQRVNNRTGATLTKGTAVYLSGSQGNRITVAKALGVTDAFSANTFGIVAENILHNQSGYVITEGLIKDINTSALVEDSAVYLSPTVAGGLTSTKPQAPQHTVYIGICVKSNAGSGELFVKIRNGQELDELHDVRITSPVDRASLYYRGGLWRDTTAALLTSDTASMLTNYLRTGVAASTYLPLAGGTLTGALNGTTGNFSTSLGVGTSVSSPVLYAGGSGNQEVHFYSDPSSEGTETILRLTNKNGSFYNYGAYFKAIRIRGINEYHAALGAGLTEFLYFENTAGGAKNLGVFNSNPSYNFDLNGTFNATGASLIGGTLGVTGATTLSAPLTVNSSAVFNEGSADADFRVESDGNANMVFVDASTDRVGIGTNAPTKTLDVNGEVRINTVTATPTSLLGKDGSNVVGQVTTVAQTGIMKAGGTTTNTSSVGIITVAHGLPYTPSQVFVTLAQQSNYIAVCHVITSTDMSFTFYDSTTGIALNNVSVGFFWLAIK